MPLSRRRAIILVGGGVVFAAAATAGRYLTTRRPDSALAPWDLAGRYDDMRMNALSFAILAPNPHNRQPWMAELTGDDGLRIHRDRTRDLPETDPFARQLTIGMGCFLELLRMAAAEQGFSLETTLFPEGENGPVADVTFRPGGSPDALFAHVFERRTNRLDYEDRPISPQAQTELARYATLITDPAEVARIRSLAWDAMQIEMHTRPALMESVDLMRIGKAEIEANPDGIALGGPFLESLALLDILSREAMSDTTSKGFMQGMEMVRKSLEATPAFAVITTSGNRREEQIEAGRDWMRLHLAATGHRLSMQPVSQALQEYSEMADHYARAHAMLAGSGGTVQMLARLGYGPSIGPSPRWPVETRISNA
ncbi:MAG: twin-arginine translocation pathway signal protein [Pseudomonadota bacterium]